MIRDDAELARVALRADADLQGIQEYLGQRVCDAGRVRFPQGFIRRVTTFEAKLWFVSAARELRRNLSYTIQSLDVYRWLITRTTLTGIACEMVIKHVLCVYASIMESLVHDALEGVIGGNVSFKKRTTRLEADHVIDGRLHGELDWLWDMRGAFHLFLMDDREIGKYTATDARRAAGTVNDLICALDAAATAKKPPRTIGC